MYLSNSISVKCLSNTRDTFRNSISSCWNSLFAPVFLFVDVFLECIHGACMCAWSDKHLVWCQWSLETLPDKVIDKSNDLSAFHFSEIIRTIFLNSWPICLVFFCTVKHDSHVNTDRQTDGQWDCHVTLDYRLEWEYECDVQLCLV